MPTELTKHREEGFTFKEVPVEDMLQGRYNDLDADCVNLLKNSIERMPWRLYVHQPYERFYRGSVCILGDAAHPMMPHQSQGACQAIEDAAALGIIFSDKYNFTQGESCPHLIRLRWHPEHSPW
jgi:salicylate hydroxylase